MRKKYFSTECMYSMILTVHGFSTQRFGIDYGGPLPEEGDREDAIVVPRVNHGISSSDYYDLCLAIDPLQHSTNYGIDIYLRVLDYVLS